MACQACLQRPLAGQRHPPEACCTSGCLSRCRARSWRAGPPPAAPAAAAGRLAGDAGAAAASSPSPATAIHRPEEQGLEGGALLLLLCRRAAAAAAVLLGCSSTVAAAFPLERWPLAIRVPDCCYAPLLHTRRAQRALPCACARASAYSCAGRHQSLPTAPSCHTAMKHRRAWQ